MRQRELDEISGTIEKLFLKQSALLRKIKTLQQQIGETDSKTQNLDKNLVETAQSRELNRQRLKNELTALQFSERILQAKLDELKTLRKSMAFRRTDYKRAIQFYHSGQYKKSIRQFREALYKNPPRDLKDNILFGLGSAYFKIRKYSKATKYLNAVIKNYPHSEKWFVSHVMLGMILNKKGEKSRALYILNQALNKNPPKSIKAMINGMIYKIQRVESGTG